MADIGSSAAPRTPAAHRSAGKRQLRLLETIAVSIAIIAPTLAMSATPGAAAALVGSAVVLPFVFAFVSIGLVAWGFVRLTSRFASAGSVYAFTGLTLGPRCGYFSGWALLGTYLGGGAASVAIAAAFAQDLIHQIGIHANVPWIIIAVLALVGAALLSMRSVRIVARSLLAIECVAVALMVILMVVIVVRVAAGFRPFGQVTVGHVFVPRHGVSLSTIALASVFAFMAFLGFEGAGSVGEEAGKPRRTIPRAILMAVIGSGILFILCAIVQSIGFGTGPTGLRAFTSSSSAFADLASAYSGRAMAIVIGIGATASGFSAALAQVGTASRMIYAVARDAGVAAPLARLSRRTREPANAILLTFVIALGLVLGCYAAGISGDRAFLYIGSFQVLVVLVAYAMTNVGAGWFLVIREKALPLRELVLPVAAICFLGYTLYKQIVPAPPAPYNVIPWIALGWLGVGAATALASPAFARRIGLGLLRSQQSARAGAHEDREDGDRDTRLSPPSGVGVADELSEA